MTIRLRSSDDDSSRTCPVSMLLSYEGCGNAGLTETLAVSFVAVKLSFAYWRENRARPSPACRCNPIGARHRPMATANTSARSVHLGDRPSSELNVLGSTGEQRKVRGGDEPSCERVRVAGDQRGWNPLHRTRSRVVLTRYL